MDEIKQLWITSRKNENVSLEEFTTLLAEALDKTADPDPYVPSTDVPSIGTGTISKYVVTQAQYEALFGMGIVNAYNAVRGPGWFDARRLDNADIVAADKYDSSGNPYAMYPVDTKGYDSEWANNIKEVPVAILPTDPLYPFVGDLNGLHVGLKKTGAGTLYLTGANSYLGPTAVEGGGISLGRTGQGNGAAELAGAVYVGKDGMFTGNGAVGGGLVSHGLLFPGLAGTPGSILAVTGAAQIDGELRLSLAADGRTNRLQVTGAANISGAKISIEDMAGGGDLPRHVYSVVESSGISGSPVNSAVQVMQGATLFNTFALYTETNNLYAAYDHSAANPRAKALPESFLGALTLLNQGADIVAGSGMDEASSAARWAAQANSGRGYGLATFSSISAGQSRYHTGSHVDVNSVSLLTGLAAGFEATPGFLTLGAFFEVGYGDYDTYNSFANAASVRGNGEAYHMGGGVLARLDFKKTGPGSFYLEASGRAGGIHNQYASGDLQDYRGRGASYDSHSSYYGLHTGLGYVWKLNEAASLDLYGKYFWTRQDGSSLTLSTNDPLHFSAVDSHRLRGGARFAYAINEHINPYLGLAYEHEFDGRAKASTYGYAIASPDLRGDTGIGELGFSLKPSPDLPISFDLGGQVYTGKREGLAGTLQMKYEF